jgi:hypothetical protein
MKETGLRVNAGKEAFVQSDNRRYLCYAIKTRLITNEDSLSEIVADYAQPYLERDDILFVSEKMVACIQGRALPVSSIRVGHLARLLCRFVSRSNAGIGLAMPETMQCAINECGTARILLAAAAGMLGKIFRRKGWFYRVAGYRVRGIDGPCPCTIPPYNQCVVLAPLKPKGTAAHISRLLGGIGVVIADANDLGVDILGSTATLDRNTIVGLLRQNPLGQSNESTPMGILRPVGMGNRECSF